MSTTTTDGLVNVDLEEVMEILPHRGDMLFVDSARVNPVKPTGKGWWYVRPDHPIFAGHYPDLPIFPGHLIAEMAAQAAGVIYAKSIGRDVAGVPLLTASSAVFESPVRPRDLLEVQVGLEQVDRRTVRAVFTGVANAGEKVASGEVTFVILPPRAARRRLGGVPSSGVPCESPSDGG